MAATIDEKIQMILDNAGVAKENGWKLDVGGYEDYRSGRRSSSLRLDHESGLCIGVSHESYTGRGSLGREKREPTTAQYVLKHAEDKAREAPTRLYSKRNEEIVLYEPGEWEHEVNALYNVITGAEEVYIAPVAVQIGVELLDEKQGMQLELF